MAIFGSFNIMTFRHGTKLYDAVVDLVKHFECGNLLRFPSSRKNKQARRFRIKRTTMTYLALQATPFIAVPDFSHDIERRPVERLVNQEKIAFISQRLAVLLFIHEHSFSTSPWLTIFNRTFSHLIQKLLNAVCTLIKVVFMKFKFRNTTEMVPNFRRENHSDTPGFILQ